MRADGALDHAGLLGQTGSTSIGDAVIWIIVLVVCCVVFGVVLMKIRRHFLGEDESSGDGGVLPMAELRRMRDAGELSDEEYRRAVDAIASRAKSMGGSSLDGGGSGGGGGGGSPD
ncbi:MAG: SHOCT domain-containing protein [Planctomycetota bacterium]